MSTTTLRVEFVSESAAYRNTFGWYNKVTGIGGVLFSDVESEGRRAPLEPGDSVTFTVDTADVGNIEFFLIDNGGGIGANSDAELSGPIKVIQLANGDWAVATLDSNGDVQMKNGKPNILVGEDSNGFFTEKSKNEGGVDHASSKVGTSQTAATLNGDTADGPTGLLAWEDLAATRNKNGTWSKPGDADYNDAVFNISIVDQPPANQAPNADNDTASVGEDDGATTINVLANDTDPDAGDTLRVSAVNAAGVLGTVAIAPGGTGIVYTPAASFQSLAAGQTATETFSYTVMDDDGATDTATATITIVGANDDPAVSAAVSGGGAEGSGTATVNLLQFASDIDNGAVLHIENLDWDEVATPGAMPAGFVQAGNAIHVDTSSPAYDAMAVGETFTTNFTYDVVDEHGARVTQHATVTITGTNDAPVVTGQNTAHLTEDELPLRQSGELTATDPDHGATRTWSIVGGTTALQDFNFSMDELRIVRNSQLFVQDTFSDGLAPPNAPNIVGGGPTSYSVGGSFFENAGRLLLAGTNATLSAVNVNGLPSAGVSATLNTDTSTNPNAGLKINQSFTVEGRFDLVMPIDHRDQYGIRLTDSTSPTTGDDVVSLAVRNEAGAIVVRLSDLNFITAIGTPLQDITLAPAAGDDQIVLRLSHDPANAGVINAAFDLLDNGVVTSTATFSSVGHIFGTDTATTADNEVWTRAQIVANGAPEAISVKQGTYATLTVDQDGDWVARVRNGQAAVQQLAEGETVTETFDVQVTDEHGASDIETVTVTVTGDNDAPIITGGTTTGAAQEDGNETAGGTLNATDIDNGATRTWSVVGEAGPHVADYHVELDSFKVIKNGNPLFEDTFGDGNPPPSAPNFIPNNGATSYAIGAGNVFVEANGRVIMDAANGASPVLIGAGAGHFATLNSNIDPNDNNLGLKSNHDFSVEGRFDLVLPDIGERYGVRFTDNAGPNRPGDDAIALSVARETDGSLRVTLTELDFNADTRTPISFAMLNPAAGDDQIVLRLTHQAANSGVLIASFDLLDNGVVTSSVTLPGFGQIFGTETPGNPGDDENWTRAEFTASDTSDTVHYGTLTINQSGQWNYDLANESAQVQALAEGETVVDSFTVQVTDEHGASDTEIINITVTGENDAPIIVGGQFTGNVQENGPQSVASGTLTAVDIDNGATRTWSIVGGPVPDVADYHFLIDNFSVIRNGVFWYNDDFGDGIEPPSGGFFFPNTPDQNAATYSVPPGVIIETGGRAIMDGHDPAGPFSFGSGVGHFVALNSNTSNSPADLDRGLKVDDDFTVEGRFELIVPDFNQNYGIRVTDSIGAANLGDDTIQLTVQSSPSGSLFLNMSRINFVNQTTTFIGSTQIFAQPGDDQIVLRLHHQAANPGVITASYELLDDGVVTGGGSHPGSAQIFGLSTPGNLADDELYTRAQFVAGESVVPTVLNGQYGSLSLNQNGNWTYFLANGQANVEALSQGEVVFDTFDIQVTDEHGAFDTETVTINVNGRNDAPVFAPTGEEAGFPVNLTEQDDTTGSPVLLSAPVSLAFTDVDLADQGHFATVVDVSGTGQTAGLPDNGTLMSFLHIDGVTKDFGSSSGTVNATLSAPDSTFDYLGQGELLFLEYTVRVSDPWFASSDVTFLVKVEGRNDLTVITDATASGSVQELPDGDVGENATTHTATGIVDFADADLTDPHQVSVAPPPPGYRGTFNASITDSANGDGAGEITWTFSVQDSDLDDLGANDTLTQTYDVQLVDQRGSLVNQTVTVTITGAADGPSIIVGTPNDDILVSTAADDLIFGLAGRDWGVFTAATGGISVNMAAGTASGAGIGNDTFDSVEHIRGGAFADSYVATSYNGNANLPNPALNTFEGMGGNDVITGNGSTQISYQSATGGVTVDFNLANAVGDASVGTDTYTGVNSVRGSAFNDILRGSDNLAGVEAFIGGAGDDLIVGRGGFDRAIVEPNVDNTVTGGVVVNMAAGTIVGDASVGTDTLRAVEAVRGTSFADTYIATSFGAPGFLNPAVNNVGSQGNFNEFEGLGGNDTIIGNGNTRIVYSLATGSVTVDLIAGTATGDSSVGVDTFSGVNSVIGSIFDDQLFGSNNAPGSGEVFEGRGGNDLIDGRGGFDQAAYNNDAFVTTGIAINLATALGGNTGTVTGDAAVGTDTLLGMESVRGTNFGDTFVATGTAFNEFEGAGGNDNATGNGNTRLSFQSAGSGVTVSLVAGTANGASTGSDTFTGVNAVRGSNSGDTIVGNSGNNFLDGLGGNDSLQGGDGNDTLTGGAGGDSLVGGNGFDTADYSTSQSGLTINIGAGGDTGDAVGDSFFSIEQIVGSNFNDVIVSDGNQHFMRGGLGADTFNGGGGFDWVMYTTSTVGLTVDLTNTANNTGEAAGDQYVNFDFISVGGSNHNDTLVGNAGSNHLMGGAGADVLDGMGESDFADYGNATGGVTASLATPGINTGDAAGDTYISIENLWGGAFSDVLTGDGGDNELQGQAGGDILDGAGGIDIATYQLSSAGVDVSLATGLGFGGDAAGDTLFNFENLRGSEWNDTLTGDGNANLLDGLGGADTLTGGGGADMFFFNLPSQGLDNILDFVSGEDKLVVTASGFGGGLVPGGPVTLVTAASKEDASNAGPGGYFILDNDSAFNGTVYWDANGGDGDDAIGLTVLASLPPLTASDFLVV